MEKGNNELSSSFSLSEFWLPTLELLLQVTLISKIFHFPCIVALQNGSRSGERRGKAADFCRAKPKLIQSSSEPIPGAATITWTLASSFSRKRGPAPCSSPAASRCLLLMELWSLSHCARSQKIIPSSKPPKSGKLQIQIQTVVL